MNTRPWKVWEEVLLCVCGRWLVREIGSRYEKRKIKSINNNNNNIGTNNNSSITIYVNSSYIIATNITITITTMIYYYEYY